MTRRPMLLAAVLLLTGCVQQAYDRTIRFEVERTGIADGAAVGVRGDDRPLSWDKDLALSLAPGDSVYRGSVTIHTGYLATELKLVVNGAFEMEGQPNRRVAFTGDTTVYRARYGVPRP